MLMKPFIEIRHFQLETEDTTSDPIVLQREV